MKIALLTLGCKLNYAETATYARAFKAAGFEVVSWSRGADLFVVNTCSVTATSDSKSRSVIRKLHRVRPDAPIVVTGCYAELRRAEVEAIDGVTRVFGAAEKAQLVPETLALLASKPSLQAGSVSANRASFSRITETVADSAGGEALVRNCATHDTIRGGTVNEVNGGVERSETSGLPEPASGFVLASDAFFPFDDCVTLAAQYGVKAIVQPGGSIRDEDSIKKCNELGIAMLFTGERHFKH